MLNFEIQHKQYNVGSQHLSSKECRPTTLTIIVSEFLGEKIKDARKRNGLTLKELGGRIGRSHATLSQIENGVHQPEKATLILLAKELNDDFGINELKEFVDFSRPQIDVRNLKIQEIVSLKFGASSTRRSKAELLLLAKILDEELGN